jgi:hypothetical protein
MKTNRAKNKIQVDYSISDFYKYYMKNKTTKNKYERPVCNKIIKEYHKKIMDKMRNENFIYRLPFGIATIRIKKYKKKIKLLDNGNVDTKSLTINWKATRDLWKNNPELKEKKKFIYYTNVHTDGFQYKYYFDKTTTRLKNMSVYYFNASRFNNRALGDLLLNPNIKVDYFE